MQIWAARADLSKISVIPSEMSQPDLELVVAGRPLGFKAGLVRKGWNKTSKKIWEYAKSIRGELKRQYGVDCLPAEKGMAWHFFTVAFFPDMRHTDPENVHKLAKDALFYRSGGLQDKVTSGSYHPPLLDRQEPRLELQGWYYRWDY